MKNTLKNLAVITVIAFMTFSFTTIDGEKKEIKKENSKI